MRIWRVLTAIAVLTTVSRASPARADTVQITAGNVALVGYLGADATYDLLAPGFRVTGAAVDTGGPLGCFPCTGGSQSISYGWGGDSWGHGSLTVGSTSYPSAWFGGDFHMTGTAPIPASATGPFAVSFPFTVTPGSSLIAFATSARTTPIFTTGLSGSGIATLTLVNSGSSTTLFDGSALRFDFSAIQTTSPTPEPFTALLVGAGLLAAYRARKQPID